jgi:hypothetical protein
MHACLVNVMNMYKRIKNYQNRHYKTEKQTTFGVWKNQGCLDEGQGWLENLMLYELHTNVKYESLHFPMFALCFSDYQIWTFSILENN